MIKIIMVALTEYFLCPSILLSTLHILLHLIFKQLYQVDSNIISIL